MRLSELKKHLLICRPKPALRVTRFLQILILLIKYASFLFLPDNEAGYTAWYRLDGVCWVLVTFLWRWPGDKWFDLIPIIGHISAWLYLWHELVATGYEQMPVQYFMAAGLILFETIKYFKVKRHHNITDIYWPPDTRTRRKID